MDEKWEDMGENQWRVKLNGLVGKTLGYGFKLLMITGIQMS